MQQIITTVEELAKVAEPLKFITAEGFDKDEGTEIILKLKEILENDKNILAISAPQIGIDKRIFCIRFNDIIKTFINPIVTKKSNYAIRPETFISMPGKEILITRPEEITVVYYTDEFKYEENKLLGAAARLFDQHCQLLDGILPSDLGLVSDVEEDGSLADLTEDEIEQITEIYKQFIDAKVRALQAQIKDDPELAKKYKELQFTEKVINGEASVVAGDGSKNRAKANAVAALSLKKMNQAQIAANRAERNTFIRRKKK